MPMGLALKSAAHPERRGLLLPLPRRLLLRRIVTCVLAGRQIDPVDPALLRGCGIDSSDPAALLSRRSQLGSDRIVGKNGRRYRRSAMQRRGEGSLDPLCILTGGFRREVTRFAGFTLADWSLFAIGGADASSEPVETGSAGAAGSNA